MEYDEEVLNTIPDGDESGGDDSLARQLAEMSEQFVAIQHELTNSKLALDEAQRRLDMFAELLAGKEAELTVANSRIAELGAQLTAIAEDARNWVDRQEFEALEARMDQYGAAQWARRHHSRNMQTVAEWLADLA